jgi:hypothetical protein
MTPPCVDAALGSSFISCFAVFTKHQTGHTVNPLSFFFTVVNIVMRGWRCWRSFHALYNAGTPLLFFSGIGQPNCLVVDSL